MYIVQNKQLLISGAIISQRRHNLLRIANIVCFLLKCAHRSLKLQVKNIAYSILNIISHSRLLDLPRIYLLLVTSLYLSNCFV
jgi:hypothetical protein